MTTARRSILRYVYTMLLLGATSSAYGVNFVNLPLTRLDDFAFPGDNFLISIDVNIPDVSGVTGVTATLGDGSLVPLSDVGGGQWFEEEPFATLDDAKSALDGTWTLVVDGSSPSSSSFSYGANSLVDGDFFATPSVTNPVNGATTVDRNTSFNWTDPTGATADLLFVFVQSEEEGLLQVDNSASGSLNIASTSWSPPSLLDVGPTEFDVLYLKANATPAGDFSVNSGTITWGDSPLDPSAGGNANPLSVIGSQTIIGFNVIPDPGTVVIDFGTADLGSITSYNEDGFQVLAVDSGSGDNHFDLESLLFLHGGNNAEEVTIDFFGAPFSLIEFDANVEGTVWELVSSNGTVLALPDGTGSSARFDSLGEDFQDITSVTFRSNTIPLMPLSTDIGIDNITLLVPTADFDSNGVVGGNDFLNWQRGYDPNCTNCTLADGDADGDQDVDGDDLAVWELQYGSVAPVSTATAVIPEPTAFMLLVSALSAAPLARTRRGKRTRRKKVGSGCAGINWLGNGE